MDNTKTLTNVSRQIILPTLIVDLICTLTIMTIGIAEGENNVGKIIWFGGVWSFCILFLPTLVAVIIFLLLNRKTTLKNKYFTKAFQTILLTIIFILGLYVWCVGHIILFQPRVGGLTISNIIEDFDYKFTGFLWTIFFEALLIPIIYGLLNKQTTN